MEQTIELPLRWWNDQDAYQQTTNLLSIEKTAFALIDCDGCAELEDYDYLVKMQSIAPALQAVRRCGMKVIYFHNAPGGEGGPGNVNKELHGTREGKVRPTPSGWKPLRPTYPEPLAPLPDEAEFQKANRNGFYDTFADQYLRTWDIQNLILVGFSLKSCLYHTCVGAQEHNYRVIVLRDGVCPPGTKEYPDTLDPANPEGGWMRFTLLRLIETNIGYTSTAPELIRACQAAILEKASLTAKEEAKEGEESRHH
jgi:nicotinamidase-related amidase